MNTLFKSVVIASAMGVAALSLSVNAADEAPQAAAKPAKEVSCKQEAKNNGIKDKAQAQAFVKDCEAKRKAAMSK